MPLDICGWIEIKGLDGKENDGEDIWLAVIRLDSLIIYPDEVSERLFGLSKRCVGGFLGTPSVAAGRGIPPFPSQNVTSDLDEIRRHEEQYGKGEIGGYTYAHWSEIKELSFDPDVLAESDWIVIFNMLRQLENDRRFSAENIRLVVWYEW